MQKFKKWLRQYFRITIFDYDAILMIEFWKFNIEVQCNLLQKGHLKVLCTPFLSIIKRKYKNPQYDIFIDFTLFQLVITYCSSYNPCHEAQD